MGLKKKIILGVVLASLFTTNFAFVEGGLEAFVTDIKLFLNDTRVDKEIIMINGSSYLPVRAISELLELEVEWDGDAKAIELSSKVIESSNPIADEMLDLMTEKFEKLEVSNQELKDLLVRNGIKIPVLDATDVFIGPDGMERLDSSDGEYITPKYPKVDYLDNKYTQGYYLSGHKDAYSSNYGYATRQDYSSFALKGQYSKFKATLSTKEGYETSVVIIADDIEIYNEKIDPIKPKDIDIDVKGAFILTIKYGGNYRNGVILENARFTK